MIRTFTLYVKFPKEEWPQIRLAEQDTEEGNRIFGEYHQRYMEKYFSGTQVETMGDWEEPQEYVVAPHDPSSSND